MISPKDYNRVPLDKRKIEKVSKSTKFKYVYKYKDVDTGEVIWKARIPDFQFTRLFVGEDFEREAAKAVDLRFAKEGKTPPNGVLIKKA